MRGGSERSRMIWIRACYRLFFNPPILFMFLFMICLRISFPYVFFLLISASPVIICTAVLLYALLALGQKHAQGTGNDALKGHMFSSSRPNSTSQADCTTSAMKGGGSSDGGSSVDGGGGGLFRDKFAEVRKDIVEKEMKESIFMDDGSNGNDQKMKGSMGDNDDHLMSIYNENFPKAKFMKQLNGEGVEEGTEVEDKERMGMSANDHQTRATTFMELRRKVKEDDYVDHCSSSSPSSSSIASEEDSDGTPKSSKVKICDYHPLTDTEDHQGLQDESPMSNEHAMELKGRYEAIHEETTEDDEISSTVQEDNEDILEHSSSDNEHKQHLEELIGERSHNYDTDVHDDEEEVEHKEVDEEDDEDDDEESHKVKEVCIKSMVDWTEEDEKNFKDVSSLELERNRQLEKIIARRRAQKSLIIPKTSNHPFHVVAPISTAKTNPFDVPSPASNHPDMTPTTPGSAPAFFPKQNPFDDFEKEPVHLSKHLTFNRSHNDEREGGETPTEDEISRREALFRRYQSFGVVGSSFYGFLWQENGESAPPFKPYFAPDQSDHANGSDSSENELIQGSGSETSSSSEEACAANSTSGHVENASEASSENNMDENQHEMKEIEKETGDGSAASSSSSGSRKEVKRSNVDNHDDHAMKVEDHPNKAREEDTSHKGPVYDSSDTSPTAVNNIFLSSDSSDLIEDKPDV